MASPALAVYTLVVIYPGLAALYYSFTNWSGLGSHPHLVGLANYHAALTSSETRRAFFNTVELAFAVTLLCTVIGLSLALALHRRTRMNYFLRLLWFLPAALPTIAAGYMWAFLYSPAGPLVQIWHSVFPGTAAPGFLASPHAALWCVAFIVLWQSWGYTMVICIAGLEGIDHEMVEAAVMDGASYLQRLRYIILPLLRPALAISATITIVDSMLVFAQIVGTTEGGPGYATQSLALQVYLQAFQYGKFGYGMAIGVVVGLVVLIMVGALTVLGRRERRGARHYGRGRTRPGMRSSHGLG